MYYDDRVLGHARVGISVSKKIGNAVIRNKIKRQIRMMFIESFDNQAYKYDVIIIVRKKYLENSYIDNKSYLEKLLKKDII